MQYAPLHNVSGNYSTQIVYRNSLESIWFCLRWRQSWTLSVLHWLFWSFLLVIAEVSIPVCMLHIFFRMWGRLMSWFFSFLGSRIKCRVWYCTRQTSSRRCEQKARSTSALYRHWSILHLTLLTTEHIWITILTAWTVFSFWTKHYLWLFQMLRMCMPSDLC